MTKKSPIIQQGKVTELMTQIANLPEREKAPDDPVSLSEIFRTKEYMTEIKGALKRGYSFIDLAEIFTEKCGIAVSARQIRYHYTRGTREKNQGVKSKSGRKTGSGNAPGKQEISEDSTQKDAAGGTGENYLKIDSGAEFPQKGAVAVSGCGDARDLEPGAFFFGK
jgi:hypothetical protein